MSFWVRAYVPQSIGPLDGKVFVDGISQRLALLTYLFCPDEEEEPQAVIDRLRFEIEDSDNLNIFYREEADRFIPVERYSGEDAADEVQEAIDALGESDEQATTSVREMLSRALETVGFELKYSDIEGMGIPVSVAAAAKLIEVYGGVINADEYGWMIPSGDEVEVILEE